MPHASSPQAALFHPAFISAVILTDPTAVVATPALPTDTSKALSPQFSKPQVSDPHPCSGKASTLPTEAVDDTPVKETTTTSSCHAFAPQVFPCTIIYYVCSSTHS